MTDKIIAAYLERFILSIPDCLSEIGMIDFEQEEALFYTFKDKIRTLKQEAEAEATLGSVDS